MKHMKHTICHNINQSPFNSSIWADCLASVEGDDCIVLINDGVYGVLSEHPFNDMMKNKTCYAIEEDVNKRGLDKLPINKNITFISYTDWVGLTVKHPLNQSWY